MNELFGSEMPLPLKFFVAFAAVLALIGIVAWVVRRFSADRLGGNARGRQPRLAVIDAATVDARRRLVLIRRDNVEHLVMIGGPTDVVVEQNIVRGTPAVTRAPDAATRSTDVPATTSRQQPAVDNGFPLQPMTESAPLTPPRPYRAPVTEEPWTAPEPGARPRPASSENSLTGLAAELSTRIAPPDIVPPVRSEPVRAEAPRVAPPVAPVAPPVAPPVAISPPVAADFEPGEAPQSDQNLADMAQQLEAALRRAPAESRAPVTDPLAVPTPKPVDVPRRDYKLRVDPRIEAPAAPKFDATKFDTAKFEEDMAWPEPSFEPRSTRQEPRLERANVRPTQPAAAPAPNPVAGKSVYDSLEQEMASLLGRPPGKT